MFLRAEEKITQIELSLANGDIEDAVTWAAMLLEQLRSAEWYVLNNNPKKAAAMMGYEPEMAEGESGGKSMTSANVKEILYASLYRDSGAGSDIGNSPKEKGRGVNITYEHTMDVICSVYRPSLSANFPSVLMVEHIGKHASCLGIVGSDYPPAQSLTGFTFETLFNNAMCRFALASRS